MTNADSNSPADTISPSEVNDFVQQFPENTRNIAASMIEGQVLSAQIYSEKEELKTTQHPHCAVSTGSRPAGHERFYVGTDEAGDTLVYRNMDSQWMGEDLRPTSKTYAFFDLVGMKGIPYVIHTKGDQSELLELSYQYSIGNHSILEGKPFIVRQYVESRQFLSHQVESRGLSFYEDLGVELSKDEGKAISQARAIQQLAWDCDVAPQRLDLPRVAPLLVTEATGDHYYFFQGKGQRRFTLIDPKAGLDDIFDDLMMMCPDYITVPEGMNLLRAKEERVNDLIVRMKLGAQEHYKALPLLQARERRLYLSSCSDSRSASSVIAGQAEDSYRWSMRSPGEFWFDARTGRLCYEAEMFLAVASMHNQRVLHVQHSTCGAASVVAKGCSGEALFSIGFAGLAFSQKMMYDKIVSRGGSLTEITNYYHKKTGIRVNSINDCVGLEDLLISRELTQRAGHDHASFAYQHMLEGRNYLLNTLTGLYTPIPTLQGHAPERHCRRTMQAPVC